MKRYILMALPLFTLSVQATTFDVLKEEVGKKNISGNTSFVGDYVNVNEAVTVANIFKILPCSDKDCNFDFSSNQKGASKDELFTCSPPAGLKINFANNDKGYIFIETPSEKPGKKPKQCSLRLEMTNKNLLAVSIISCPQEKIGDCNRDSFIGNFKRLGRPGFDCGVLTPYLELTPARRTICHSLELSELDHDLDEMYATVESKDDFHKAQTLFMRNREACGNNENCLKILYLKWREYIKSLQKPAAK